MAVDMMTRNKQIKAALKDGKTQAEVAEKFKLSTARIWKIANDFVEKPASGKKAKAKSKSKAAKKSSAKTRKPAGKLGITKAHSARKAAVKKAALKTSGNGKPNGTKLSDAASAVQG